MEDNNFVNQIKAYHEDLDLTDANEPEFDRQFLYFPFAEDNYGDAGDISTPDGRFEAILANCEDDCWTVCVWRGGASHFSEYGPYNFKDAYDKFITIVKNEHNNGLLIVELRIKDFFRNTGILVYGNDYDDFYNLNEDLEFDEVSNTFNEKLVNLIVTAFSDCIDNHSWIAVPDINADDTVFVIGKGNGFPDTLDFIIKIDGDNIYEAAYDADDDAKLAKKILNGEPVDINEGVLDNYRDWYALGFELCNHKNILTLLETYGISVEKAFNLAKEFGLVKEAVTEDLDFDDSSDIEYDPKYLKAGFPSRYTETNREEFIENHIDGDHWETVYWLENCLSCYVKNGSIHEVDFKTAYRRFLEVVEQAENENPNDVARISNIEVRWNSPGEIPYTALMWVAPDLNEDLDFDDISDDDYMMFVDFGEGASDINSTKEKRLKVIERNGNEQHWTADYWTKELTGTYNGHPSRYHQDNEYKTFEDAFKVFKELIAKADTLGIRVAELRFATNFTGYAYENRSAILVWKSRDYDIDEAQ